MTQFDFATNLDKAFKAQGWTTSKVETTAPDSYLGRTAVVTLDVWSYGISQRCTRSRAKTAVNRLVRTEKLNPTQVHFSVERGHLCVFYQP